MSGDPYRKAIPGERLKIPARAWNKLIDDIAISPGFHSQSDVPSQVVTMTATISKASADGEMNNWPSHLTTVNGTKLQVGYGISLDGAPLNIPSLTNWNGKPTKLDNLSDLATVQTGLGGRYVKLGGTGGASEQFGVVTSVSVNAADEGNPETYNVTFIAAGVFVCRCIAFALCDRLLGPPPIPSNANTKALWYPYPMMAPAGTARVLATGAYWQIGANSWPRIYEVVARM